MRSKFPKLNLDVSRWARMRFAFPLLALLFAAFLFVSEETYDETTASLREGRAITDARMQSLRLLQLLTEAETAQFAYLATGNTQYLARYADVKEGIPAVLQSVGPFFKQHGLKDSTVAQQVADLTRQHFVGIDRILAMAQAGDPEAAKSLAVSVSGGSGPSDLREMLLVQLSHATQLQLETRKSINKALLGQRIAIGLLTGLSLLSLFLLLRQFKRQNRVRDFRQSALLEERENLEVQVQHRTARLTELASHLQSVSEDERAHLARELHDELGGLLTVCKLEIARARAKAGQPEEVLKRLDSVTEHLNKGIALKRRIIEDLRPSWLTHLGLAVALQNLCHEMSDSLGIPVQLSMANSRLSADAELAVYRFVQEALTNIGKYAGATQVDISLEVVDGKAVVAVRDDGTGFELKDSRVGHHGLSGMQFRAESLGGSMHIRSAPGQGTTVRIEFAEVSDSEFMAERRAGN